MKCVIINIDEEKRQNTTLRKIKQCLCNYSMDSIELIVFNVINTTNKYINLERIAQLNDYYSKKIGKKCTFNFNPPIF